jgi:hypothetical protein
VQADRVSGTAVWLLCDQFVYSDRRSEWDNCWGGVVVGLCIHTEGVSETSVR